MLAVATPAPSRSGNIGSDNIDPRSGGGNIRSATSTLSRRDNVGSLLAVATSTDVAAAAILAVATPDPSQGSNVGTDNIDRHGYHV
jgi:hypothetical protein